MSPPAVLAFALRSLAAVPLRTALTLLAVGIGAGAVLTLSALGEGARRYVTREFAALGTNLLVVLPGRSETAGVTPGLFLGETPRDLTLDDALALARSPHVRRVAPIVVGSARVSHGARAREATVLASTPGLVAIRRWRIARGRNLPEGDPRRGRSACLLGARLARELFGAEPALGRWVRVGDRRLRVVGVLAAQGFGLGIQTDDMVIVPVATGMALFRTESLFRIMVEARSREAVPLAREAVRAILRERHGGEEDVTVVTQDAVLGAFDRILRALTYALAGLAGISLGVAGILVMNVMLIGVAARRAEIGLLKALGAPPGLIGRLFLAEAALLGAAGGLAGLGVGWLAVLLVGRIYPAFPIAAPGWAAAAAFGVALAGATLFGLLPARRAARLDPVAALADRG